MSRIKKILVVILVLLFSRSLVSGSYVKTFVPSKPWQITIDLNDFEPWDLLQPKAILGGRTQDDVIITIIVEKTKSGTKPAEIRKIYGQPTALEFGKEETIEEIDVNNIAIIAYEWITPDLPNVNENKLKWIKDATKNKWSFNGYVVKDDIAFDIHLSSDMSKNTKKQMLDIIKSFRIESSTEIQELVKVYNALYKEFETDKDKTIQVKSRLKLAYEFIKKYPGNPDIQMFIGDHYLSTRELGLAKKAYLKAIENHNSQPLRSPMSLWTCYDGLGLCYGMSKEYDQAKKYFELGYTLAKKMDDSNHIAYSAYNLACFFAEIMDTDNSLKYLAESIKLDPDSKEQAKQDSSFVNIKDDQRFKALIFK